jgi:tetratricopeptide (TPR) repeat protein
MGQWKSGVALVSVWGATRRRRGGAGLDTVRAVGSPGDQALSGGGRSRGPDGWLEAVMDEERRGELLAAFDVAERGLAEHPGDVRLKHRAVLALARAGATEEASKRFRLYGLDAVHDEDVAALRARIAKDRALASRDEAQRVGAARAARLYAEVFARTGGYYPAINAATLWLVAGDVARSVQLARRVLELVARSGEVSYYAAATKAEAELLLGRSEPARETLERAATLNAQDYGALATTRRQLRMICEIQCLDEGLLSPLAGPGVVHVCGHRIGAPGEASRFPAEAEESAASGIARVLDAHRVGFAYGALAAGADILWAEALLARGCELHVVLPFPEREFVELSVASCGEGWVERFHNCLAEATDIRYGTDDTREPDDVLFNYGGELAMGLALLRARYLDADVIQLALWDGRPADGSAGTAIDVATWQRAGWCTTVVTPDGEVTTGDRIPSGRQADGHRRSVPLPPRSWLQAAQTAQRERVVRAMLFGDFARFSELTDEQAVVFAERVLGKVAEVIRRHREHVRWRNTWGDGLNVMLTDAVAAAAFALDLQDAMAAIDLESQDLPRHLALRLGGHVGPVFPVYDPVLEAEAFTGTHVNRTARIEPVTPPGEVYVTDAFAAALVLAGQHELTCDYVGHMPAAKGYGNLRMHRLRRTSWGDEPAPVPTPEPSRTGGCAG